MYTITNNKEKTKQFNENNNASYKQSNFDDKGFIKTVITIAIPSMLAFMIDYLYQLTDTYWISQIGLGAPTAINIATSILFLFMFLNSIVSSSTMAIFSQTFASGDKDRTGYVIWQGIFFKFLLGVLAGILYIIVINNLLFLYTKDKDVIAMVKEYGDIIFFSLIIMLPYGSMLTGLRTINEAPKTLIISIICVLFNVVLDPILIFGIGIIDPILKFLSLPTVVELGLSPDMFALGIKGGAIATIVTQFLGMIIAVIILLGNKEGIRVFKQRHLKFDKNIYIKMMTIGLPIGAVSLIWHIEQNVTVAIVSTFGVAISDGFGIAVKIRGLFFLAMFGLSLGSALACGKYIGKGKFDVITKNMKKMLGLGLLMMVHVTIPVLIFAEEIVKLFKDDVAKTVEAGALFLRFFAVIVIFVCFKFIVEGAFKGAGRNMPLLVANGIIMILIEVPLLFILRFGFNLGIMPIAVSIAITNVLAFIVTYILFKMGFWKKRVNLH